MLAAATSSDSQHGSFSFLGWLRDCILLINMYSPMRYVKRKNACGTSIKPKILRILSFCLNLFAHSFVRSVILCVFFLHTNTHALALTLKLAHIYTTTSKTYQTGKQFRGHQWKCSVMEYTKFVDVSVHYGQQMSSAHFFGVQYTLGGL